MRTAAIVLAGGTGSRMGSDIPKQFMELCGKPVLYYTLKAFQDSPVVDEITLVIGETKDNTQDEMYNKIISKYNISKINRIVRGGQKRSKSVFNGLSGLKNTDYVFIQDSARIFLDEKLIEDTFEGAKITGGCLAAAPVRDTIKISDGEGSVLSSPDRSTLWIAQTPQTFRYDLIMSCYDKYHQQAHSETLPEITDDASLVGLYSDTKVKLIRTSYWNMKITEPEDLAVAEALISLRMQ